MRRCLAATCLCAATLAPTGALSQDATWRADASGSYSSSTNWTPAVVPKGAATFSQSQATSVVFSSAIFGQTTVGAFVFTPDAPAYTFNAGSSIFFGVRVGSQLVFNGAGIVNNSSNAPTFINPIGSTTFTSGRAGNAVFIVNGGSLEFAGPSNATDARITNTSSVAFANSSTAGNATIVNNVGGFTHFRDSATAGNAVITTNASSQTLFDATSSAGNSTLAVNQGTLSFEGSATAANASLANTSGVIAFRNSATAGNANIVSTGGRITFQNSSIAGNAIIAATSSAQISFADQAQGGQARVIVDGTSAVTFGSLLSVGSIEGAGLFVVDAPSQNEIFVGTNNLSTVVSGTITSSRPSATLNKTGSGTLTLLGTNTLTGLGLFGGAVATNRDAGLGSANGSLRFAGGTLQLLSSFDLSPARTITLASGNGTIDTNGFNMTIAQAIVGDSGLLKTGLGTLTLAGNSTFGGGTYVFGGSLVLNGGLASGVTVAGPGSLVVNGTVAGDVVNAGMTTVNGRINGNVNNNAGSLLVNGTVASNVVNAGTTTVNGRIGGNVANSGLLGGTGVIAGNVTNSGTIGPGNSIGTLTISGNLVNTGSGTLAAEVTGAGQSDRLNVGGAATLQGGTVAVQPQAGIYAPRTTYTIVSATGGVNGTFASVSDPYPFLQPSLSYDANNVYLTLQVGGFAAAAQTPTQYAVGTVLDAAAPGATGDFATVLGNLATLGTAQGLSVLTSISGQNYAGFSTAMVQGAQLFMNNFATQAGGGQAAGSSRVALAEACDVACEATSPALWGAWGGGLGGLGTIGANAGTGAVTYNVGGFAAGLDRFVVPSLRVGVTAGYTTGTQWVSGFDGRGTSDTFLAGLYANYSEGKVYVDGLAAYAYSYNQMWRNIAVPGLQQRTAQGQTGANQFFGQLEGGYRVDLGGTAAAFVTPFARLQAYTGTQNGFSEFGAQSLNLTVAAQTTNSLRSVLGAQLGGAMDLGWREKLALQFRLGWSHEYADTARPVSAILAGAPTVPFTTYGIASQRDGVVVGLSANTAVADAASLYLRYEGNISGQDSTHALTAGLRMTW
jgi:outer membrane autotransporter protein